MIRFARRRIARLVRHRKPRNASLWLDQTEWIQPDSSCRVKGQASVRRVRGRLPAPRVGPQPFVSCMVTALQRC